MPTRLNKALHSVTREGGMQKIGDEDRANKDFDFWVEFDKMPDRYKNLELAKAQFETFSFINGDGFQYLKKQLEDAAPQSRDDCMLASDADIVIFDMDYRDVLKELALNYPDERICVHNPASRFQAFGAWVGGARAMEEQIARASDLVNYHKAGRYSEESIDQALYMSDVFFWRDSAENNYDFLIKLSEDKSKYDLLPGFVIADVATAPSMDMRPDASKPEWQDKETRLEEIRIRFECYVVKPAIERGVQHLIFSGAGCGAYRCDADEVAGVYAEVLKKYRRKFKTITGALYGGGLAKKFQKVFDTFFPEESVSIGDVLASGILRPAISPNESKPKKSRGPVI